MSLQGTLDTFALPDVLRLLASTAKTGYLRLEGSHGSGGVWFSAGRVAATAAPRRGRIAQPVPPGAEPLVELLRRTDGSFVFESGTASPLDGPTSEVASLLDEAEVLLEEWRQVESVVPSIACSVELRPSLDVPSVSVSADQWRALVAVASGSTVEDVGTALALGELSASRTVKELVEAGLVEVGSAPVVETPPVTAPEPEVEPEVAVSTPEPAADEEGSDALVLDVLHELADGGDPQRLELDAAVESPDTEPARELDAGEGRDDAAEAPAPEPAPDGPVASAVGPVAAPHVPQAPRVPQASRPVARPAGQPPAFRLPAPPQPVAPADGFLRRPPVARPGSARTVQDGRLSSSLGELAAIADRGRQVPEVAAPAAPDDDTQAVARHLSELGPDAAAKVAAVAEAGTTGERDAALDAIEAATDGQPVNRSALLKFLSSVRT